MPLQQQLARQDFGHRLTLQAPFNRADVKCLSAVIRQLKLLARMKSAVLGSLCNEAAITAAVRRRTSSAEQARDREIRYHRRQDNCGP